eukprot:m.59478 g.59478  ORF g.59478 m.59478 type:complete len:143 (+) comp13585_c0_seq2:62-490(+)
MAELKHIFDLHGGKAKGKLPAASVGDVVRSMKLCVTERQLKAALTKHNVTAEADLKQVEAIVKDLSSMKDQNLRTSIKASLRVFDPNDSGSVTVSEISHVLSSLGEKMRQEDLDEIFRQADVDQYGAINVEDFALMLASVVE